MRLLETTDGRTYNLTSDFIHEDHIPPYAILSHTWEEKQEVIFNDLIEDGRSSYCKLRTTLRLLPRSGKIGYDKLRFCAKQANRDGLRYFWVDSCCINQNDSQELEKSINSMFEWYENAAKCYVYLPDVSTAWQTNKVSVPAWQPAFRKSRWFTRGWTLQELLAPTVVEFFSREGRYLGNRVELRDLIHDITDIPLEALSGTPLSEFGIDQRLSWAVERQTKREEDEVYALLGIFNIKLPFIYTEGYDSALRRLLDAIEDIRTASDVGLDRSKHTLQSHIPFRRDKDFISRKSLAVAHYLFAEPEACVALVGLGGVGKSQIAIEYAYQVLDKSPNTLVFWVHAENEARFRNSYHDIAERIKMHGWDDPKANIVELVNAWLRDDADEPWLMIIDSADDASVLFDNAPAPNTSSEPTQATTRLPRSLSCGGSILVTSRSREVACTLTNSEKNIIEIGPMDDHDALALLRKKFNATIKSAEATALMKALDNMPLALTQAAAFINRTPRMSISRYLKTIDENRAHVLKEGKGKVDIRRDHQASNSITTTWQLSFDYIRKRSLAAARLLSLMSFFDRQGIPRSLLEGNYAAEHHQSTFEDDMYMLTSFCLVKSSEDGKAFEMHGLVQYATREWLDKQGELSYWKECIVTLMDKHYPIGHYENLAECQTLLPHAQAAIDNIPQEEDALEAWASLCFKMAWYTAGRGNLDKAHKLILDSYDVRTILWGNDAPLTLDSLNSLALILHQSGRYHEAEEMHRKALKGMTQTFGTESKDTLNSMVNLAGVYIEEWQWSQAEKLLLEALELSRKALGPHHSLTLNAMTFLATTYRSQSRWSEATELELGLLKIRKMQLGPGHPLTLGVESNLAFTYRKQGRLKEAEQLHLQTLKSYLASPDLELETLDLKTHLAHTYKDQGRLSESEALYTELVHASKAKLGPAHFDTLTRMSHLSSNLCAQGRYAEASDLISQTLALRESTLGREHLSTLDSKALLAIALRGQSLLDKAEAVGREVLEVYKKRLGEAHPLTLDSVNGLARTYREQGRLDEAVELEECVARARFEVSRPERVGMQAEMKCFADACDWQGQSEGALRGA